MGYSGTIVVARFENPISTSPLSRELPVLDEVAFEDGWRCMWLDRDSPLDPQEVVAVTNAPALCAYVFDSDVADVEATSPQGNYWHVYLHPDAANELGAPALQQSLVEVISMATAWAEEIGTVVEPMAVAQAVAAEEIFVEDTLVNLVQALGIASS